MLDNIIIVLSHTTEPANIGAACRAMKTMGLSRLRLINPHDPHGAKARALAHGAQDVLEAAEICPDLQTALREVEITAGTTSRQRQLRKHALLSPGELAQRMLPHAAEGPVAILFGTERTGLTNDEANVCRYLSTIETKAPQPSLNLAQAVMIYCWEIWRQRQDIDCGQLGGGKPVPVQRPEMNVRHPHRSTKLPTQFELDMTYAHLAKGMEAIGYSEFERSKFLTYLRQMHMRAGIVDWELQIYHLLARRILEATGQPAFNGDD